MNTKLLGAFGEQEGAKYLRKNGYNIISANYRMESGELDIVAEKKKVLCFVEVKTRTEGAMLAPSTAVTETKKSNLRYAAKNYMARMKYQGKYRFDILEVIVSETGDLVSINHIENAFGM